MIDTVLEHAESLRLSIFICVFCLVSCVEIWWPVRSEAPRKWQRRGVNLTILFIGALLLRLIGPVTAMAVAYWVESEQLGLLNLIEVPVIAAVAIAVVLLDLAIYVQHWALHKVPLLWRFHAVHHTDEAFGVTTAVRFHPLEIVASMLFKSSLVIALGAPVFAVFLLEVLLSSAALFNHSNIAIPAKIDRWLRWIWVTPDMHRVHHSILRRETDSNYGFHFSFWDRLFKTYVDQPKHGHRHMQIGLPKYRSSGVSDLPRLLLYPFTK